MMWLLLACSDPLGDGDDTPPADADADTDTDSDTDADSDVDTDTDADTDTDTGPLPGFEFDGGTYTLGDGTTTCDATIGPWTVAGSGQRDGSGAPATANVLFASEPRPGQYPVTTFVEGAFPAPTEAWIVVFDFRDTAGTMSVSDGGSGVVTVTEDRAVVWTSTTLGTLTTASGWIVCP